MLTILLASAATCLAEPAEKAIETAAAATQEAAASQARVDEIAADTRSMLEQYREAVAMADDLKAYNGQLERMVATQSAEIFAMSSQTQANPVTREKLLPLLQRMVDTLEEFVSLDTPFLKEERTERVKSLKELMSLPDVGIAEKYRRIMEAYQVEAEYGRTIEAYTGTLPAAGEKPVTVNFLRVGRMALLYSALDGTSGGYWDASAKAFKPLASGFVREIETGLRIARKESAPDLLKIPLPAPEVVK